LIPLLIAVILTVGGVFIINKFKSYGSITAFEDADGYVYQCSMSKEQQPIISSDWLLQDSAYT
jgi:hypothetical protein